MNGTTYSPFPKLPKAAPENGQDAELGGGYPLAGGAKPGAEDSPAVSSGLGKKVEMEVQQD